MRKWIAIAFSAVLLLNLSACSQIPEVGIKKVTLYALTQHVDKSEGEVKTYSYDKDGNMIQKTICIEEVESLRYEYEYNRKHQLVAKTIYADGNESSRTVYEYDDNGNEVLATTTFDGKEAFRAISEYDKDSNLILYECYYYQEISTEHYEYKYDKYGNPILVTHPYEERTACYTYEYDENGNVIKYTFSQDGISRMAPSEYKYEYDEYGNMVRIVVFRGNYVQSKTEFEYNQDGKKTKEYHFYNGNVERQRIELEYDKDGRKQQKTEYYREYLLNQAKYEYDDNGYTVIYDNGDSERYTTFQVSKSQAEALIKKWGADIYQISQ